MPTVQYLNKWGRGRTPHTIPDGMVGWSRSNVRRLEPLYTRAGQYIIFKACMAKINKDKTKRNRKKDIACMRAHLFKIVNTHSLPSTPWSSSSSGVADTNTKTQPQVLPPLGQETKKNKKENTLNRTQMQKSSSSTRGLVSRTCRQLSCARRCCCRHFVTIHIMTFVNLIIAGDRYYARGRQITGGKRKERRQSEIEIESKGKDGR
ncbi:hypothetical protein P168DRAFT_188722 [Aspergillus campestris IBT 28561]|uniref:Uncharacterized protein n=1 Tax=Aspergillus campestris (strain IBT 28561) TaxID=1392248 RepID=A0A2I1CYH1_ASPC2|nr:uncharacterized protein P168DRAFT_188722 [Aspergillus campestris IBT 28561]PKY02668.1 hypothetical protein P168DRAFT_188722 [Aspergillus campestris IBT 28561]